jgi:putative ABC transport system permease protein
MIGVGPRFVVVLVILMALASVAGMVARLGIARSTLTASVRAVAQLSAVSLVIVLVLHSWSLALAFVVVMFAVACVTSARRIGRHRSSLWAATAILAGVLPTFGLIVASGSVPHTAVATVPIIGILIGGAMTATSLAGRRAMDSLRTGYGEYEAALALGFTSRDAAALVCGPTAKDALLPALDQTRTVGLVTLPGAFVGVLLGGGSPVQAGAVQLLVLVALLAVETIAIIVTTELVARQVIRWVGVGFRSPGTGQRPPRAGIRWSRNGTAVQA